MEKLKNLKDKAKYKLVLEELERFKKLIEINAGHGLSVKFLNEFYPQIETFLKSD